MSQTKIFVIHMKELIIGLIVAAVLILLTILALVCFNGKSSSSTSRRTAQSAHTSDNMSAPTESERKTGAASSTTYLPGVYTSSISVNGTPLEIQVSVDENNINAVELKNMSESVTTMYPMMQTSFQELADQVVKNGSIENVSYSADNKYTATMLLQGIQQALEKCIQK